MPTGTLLTYIATPPIAPCTFGTMIAFQRRCDVLDGERVGTKDRPPYRPPDEFLCRERDRRRDVPSGESFGDQAQFRDRAALVAEERARGLPQRSAGGLSSPPSGRLAVHRRSDRNGRHSSAEAVGWRCCSLVGEQEG